MSDVKNDQNLINDNPDDTKSKSKSKKSYYLPCLTLPSRSKSRSKSRKSKKGEKKPEPQIEEPKPESKKSVRHDLEEEKQEPTGYQDPMKMGQDDREMNEEEYCKFPLLVIQIRGPFQENFHHDPWQRQGG